MALASHIDFIVVAYSAATVILSALIAWIMLDYRALRRTLAEFKDDGVTRRSDRAAGSPR